MSLLPVGFGASGEDYTIDDSLRLRSSASAYLSWTPGSNGNRQIFTFSVWVKRGALGAENVIFHAGTASTNRGHLRFNSDDTCEWAYYNGSWILWLKTTAVFRDPSAWYHIVGRCNTTNGTSNLYINGVDQTSLSQNAKPSGSQSTSFGQAVEHQLGQRGFGDAGYLDGYVTEANFIDGQALTADDFGEFDANGTWKAKKYTGTHGTNGFYLPMKPTTQAELQNTVLYSGTAATQSIDGCGYAPDLVWLKSRNAAYSNALFDSVRGASKWLTSNGTNAEAAVSGVTSFDSDGFTLGADTGQNNSGTSYVAWTWDAGDNQPSTGHSSIIWKGTGNVGTREFSGFGFSPDLIWLKGRTYGGSHQLYDSVRGGLNKLFTNGTSAESSTNTYGLLSSFTDDGFIATQGSSDFQEINNAGSTFVAWGWDAGDNNPVSNTTGDINSTVKANDATGFSIVSYTGNGSNGATVGHGLSTTPAVVIVRDRNNTNNWAVYHKDLTSTSHSLVLNSTAAETNYGSSFIAPASSTLSLANGSQLNASSRAYIAYCFSEVSGVSKFGTYTGNGSTTGPTITTGFRPGFVMIKSSTQAGTDWLILDSTRSPFNTIDEVLRANLSNTEVGTGYGDMDVSDTGFQIKTNGASSNTNGQTYIYMAFKGSYSDYVSPLNDTGTIDSRVKANPDKGFSIVSYTGTGATSSGVTIGHGLGATPDFVITKKRSGGTDYGWSTWHKDLGGNYGVWLDKTNARNSSMWDGYTNFSSTVFSPPNLLYGNENGATYINYCFAEVAGYSKFGSYTGTGTTTGNVTTVGFRPAFLMVKGTSITSEWVILDNTRDPNPDPAKHVLIPNRTNADSTAAAGLYVKFTDTGFQPVGVGTDTNSSGQTYIYMAIADTRDAVFNFDASGNQNNWEANNINSNADSETTYDLMKDTPSLVDENAGNFATLNPLDKGSQVTLSSGNLDVSWSNVTGHSVRSTLSVSSGKWYAEYTMGSSRASVGIAKPNNNAVGASWIGSSAYGSGGSYGYGPNGLAYTNGSGSTYGASWVAGDVIGIAFDADAGTITFYKNGVSQGQAYSGISGEFAFGVGYFGSPTGGTPGNMNFGQRPFKYTPPTGFLKLNTFNLPDSTIEKGDDYFNTVLYTAASSNGTYQITGNGFQPDFSWVKNRDNVERHLLFDSVRGNTSMTDKFLVTSNTSAEGANGVAGTTVTVNADGMQVVETSINSGELYFNSRTYVMWNWKANGSGVSNTDGSVTATVSANPTAGFSIVGFTAPSGTGNFSAGHGLGVTPAMVIVKTRDSSVAPWYTWHNTFSNLTDDYVRLNATSAKQTQSSGWGAGMTSSVIGLRAGYTTVGTEDHIAYCFAEVPGYSAFGSYTGNGSADGPFVYTGFRPAFVIIKRSDSTANWLMYDNKRLGYNPNNNYLLPDLANAEGSGDNYPDLLSNGFKPRVANQSFNVSGGTYIYMAFAENPFKNANAR